MKRQIRTNVFETNSSSMHSLVVMKQDERFTEEEIRNDLWVNDNGELNLHGELYFGRSPFDMLSGFEDKLKYAIASMVREYKDDVFNELLSIVKKYVPEVKEITLPRTSEEVYNKSNFTSEDWQYKYAKTEEEFLEYLDNLEEKWGLEKDSLDYWTSSDGDCFYYDSYDTGSVDEDILTGFLEKENITLEEFLVNKKYVVIVDGDEYCIYKKMRKTGLINEDIIDHEY